MKRNSLLEKCKIAGYICAAFGWWGLLYPEFTMTEDVCRMVNEFGQMVEVAEWDGPQEQNTYWQLLEAGPEHIRFRSRFLEELENMK